MINSNDPKTTAAGIVLIIMGILSWLFGVGFVELFKAVGNLNVPALLAVLMPILTGTGLLAAKDNDITT